MYFLKVLLIIIISLAFGGAVVYGVAKFNPELLGIKSNVIQFDTEIDTIVAEVSSLMDLPKDELPTLATVTDLNNISGQDFFKNANLGDKVLIFTNNKKAIIYRPSTKKIIEVGVVNINQKNLEIVEEVAEKESDIPVATTSASPSVLLTPEPSPQNKIQ